MHENLTSPQSQEQITPQLAAEWVRYADQIAPYDQLTVIDRGNGQESFVLKDALNVQVRDDNGAVIGRKPSVVLGREDGTTETLDATDFLTYVGADSFGLQSIINGAKRSETQHSDVLAERVQTTATTIFAGETALSESVSYDKSTSVDDYDALFAVDLSDTATVSESLSVPETRNPRLEALFAPIMSHDEFVASNPIPAANYDHLFMEDGPERNAILHKIAQENMVRQAQEMSYPTINDASKKEAATMLQTVRSRDGVIDATILEYIKTHPDTDPVDAIRTDSDLRYVLGEYLLQTKMNDRLMRMPYRVRANDNKRPNHRGYSKFNSMTSREYATLLALAMIDGTYVGTPKGDEIDTNPNTGEVLLGQHRAAAMELLK